MFSKKNSCDKKIAKGFTLVEIIVVLVILAVLAAATIPSLLGFIDDAKFKTIDNEARVVRNAAQAYATEQSAKGETDTDIENRINGVINSGHALHNLLQNDANGTVFETKVEKGKIRKFNYTKEIIEQNEDIITNKIRYAIFDDTKSLLLHATGSVTTIDIDDFKTKMKADLVEELTASLGSSLATGMNDMKTDLQTDLTSSLTTTLTSNLLNSVYPVGSLYISYNNTSPATLFGGTWTQITNRFLYCSTSSGVEDGNSTHTHTTGSHTLTIDEIPSHDHLVAHVTGDRASSGNSESWFTYQTLARDNHSYYNHSSAATGGGAAHNHGNTGSASNMPPYVTVYCWRRTA